MKKKMKKEKETIGDIAELNPKEFDEWWFQKVKETNENPLKYLGDFEYLAILHLKEIKKLCQKKKRNEKRKRNKLL